MKFDGNYQAYPQILATQYPHEYLFKRNVQALTMGAQ